eukprot:3287693-Rhodomonas_salina.2
MRATGTCRRGRRSCCTCRGAWQTRRCGTSGPSRSPRWAPSTTSTAAPSASASHRAASARADARADVEARRRESQRGGRRSGKESLRTRRDTEASSWRVAEPRASKASRARAWFDILGPWFDILGPGHAVARATPPTVKRNTGPSY